MRRILAVVLLLAQPAFAALPHAALDAPLTPVVSAPALLVGGAPPTGVTLMPALAPTLSAATVMLSMPASAPAVPSATAFAAAPISAAAPAADPPSPGKYMYMSETPAAPAPRREEFRPRIAWGL